MLDFRLKALEHFLSQPMPQWGADLSDDRLRRHLLLPQADRGQAKTWDDVPDGHQETFDKLGIPEAERKYLAGVGAQYESEVVYHSLQEDLAKQGVIFMDMDSGLREHGSCPAVLRHDHPATNDNKFAALNSAVWSGGSFIYVPPGVKVEIPLQAYFRINAENMGQFERTLIIVDEGAYVHYVEGCTAPIYSTDSLHSAVVEIIVKQGRPLPLHDDPELVDQRLQPGHQARGGRTRTRPWSGSTATSARKLTMKYPAVLPDGRRRARRGAVDRLRRQGPAPGRRRQDRRTPRPTRPP